MKMPLIWSEQTKSPSDIELEVADYSLHRHKRRKLTTEDMGSRRSTSSEAGISVSKMEEPINRGYIIERLKSQTRDMTQDLQAPDGMGRLSLEKATLPALDQISPYTQNLTKDSDIYATGLDIARPRSALHAGDFRQDDDFKNTSVLEYSNSPFAASPPESTTQSPLSAPHYEHTTTQPYSETKSGLPSSSKFQLLPPTSPLIHTSLNSDTDISHIRQQSPSPGARRLTFASSSVQATYSSAGMSGQRKCFLGHAYQAHQPQRPINIPQGPRLRPRGTSNSSDLSPLQHASMVGSYEESILRGRMSTNPSRPVDFIAQIGVAGKGKCKPSLKCPPHVSVPFPAVFYSDNSASTAPYDRFPSPYVGNIDIENSLPSYDGKAPLGGCYRIPQQGQLQIIIKNPHNTALKLFLVPYNFKDMEPGTKTFIRQRSYNHGPIVDMPLSASKISGASDPGASPTSADHSLFKPTLQYLIHLHICCTARGRYFLHRSIRVVFASRAPNGKSRLRNETQHPEPKYTPYKPTVSVTSSPRAAAQQALECSSPPSLAQVLAGRRRSTPFSLIDSSLDQADGLLKNDGPPLVSPIPSSWQRRLCIPLQQSEDQHESHDISHSRAHNKGDSDPSSSRDGASIMEPFETWLSKHRKNANPD